MRDFTSRNYIIIVILTEGLKLCADTFAMCALIEVGVVAQASNRRISSINQLEDNVTDTAVAASPRRRNQSHQHHYIYCHRVSEPWQQQLSLSASS